MLAGFGEHTGTPHSPAFPSRGSALTHTYHGNLDQEYDMSGTTTDQHAVTPSNEVKAVDRLVGQMADLSVVGGEAG
jgi:hypothetical protein